MNDFPIKIGIINCLMQKGDSAKYNDEETKQYIKNRIAKGE